MKKKQKETPIQDKKMSKIDIKGGKLTFGQRIELGKIFQSSENEIVKFEKVFECLHKFKPKATQYKKLLPYFQDIIEGIAFWIEKEQTMLKYEPTAEEMSAGIIELTKKIGEFGTIKALAKNYSKDPDEILEWEYGKVFGILYTDFEEYEFQKRYDKVIEKKYKK